MSRLPIALAALLLSACASTSEPRILVETREVPVPVPTPVPVSPTMTDPGTQPELPEGRLSHEDLVHHLEALAGYACALRAKLADIAIAHGAGGEPVECTEAE